MKVSHYTENGVCVVSFHSNLQSVSLDDLNQNIKPLINDHTSFAVIFDLENVKLLDSSGIRMIAFVIKSLNQANKKFALCHLKPMVMDLIKLVQLHKVCHIFPTKEDAILEYSCQSERLVDSLA